MSERYDYGNTDMFQATFGKRPPTRKELRRAEKEARKQAKQEEKEAKRLLALEKKRGRHSTAATGAHASNKVSSAYTGRGKHEAVRAMETDRASLPCC